MVKQQKYEVTKEIERCWLSHSHDAASVPGSFSEIPRLDTISYIVGCFWWKLQLIYVLMMIYFNGLE